MLMRFMLLVTVIALLGACETIHNYNVAHELDENSKSYNLMLRWNELDKAETIFPPEKNREDFKEKVKAAKGVRVADYRIKSKECSVEKGEAKVVIDIDYYREPSIKLRTVEDVQKWKYVEEAKDVWKWRLMTLPPDFE
jgi:hypothetical protein